MNKQFLIPWTDQKVALRNSWPLIANFSIENDCEAGVFVASTDAFLPVFAIACEGETLDALSDEILDRMKDAVEEIERRLGY